MNSPLNGKDMERREFFNGFQQPFGHRLHSTLFPSGLYEDIKFQKRRLLSKGVCRRHDTKRWKNNLNNQDTKPNVESHRAAELAYLNEAGCFYTIRGTLPVLSLNSGNLIWISLCVERWVPKKGQVVYKSQNVRDRQVPRVNMVPCGAGWPLLVECVRVYVLELSLCMPPLTPRSSEDQTQPREKTLTQEGVRACAVED